MLLPNMVSHLIITLMEKKSRVMITLQLEMKLKFVSMKVVKMR